MLLSKELITIDGNRIFPTFMSAEERQELKDKYEGKREFMWCTCRSDEKLYYRVSSDLRIYPEHNGYEHDDSCIFAEINKDRRAKAYLADAETGEVEVFLKFNPENFTEQTHSGSGSSNANGDVAAAEEEAFLSLEYFIRDLNIDTYNCRVSTGDPLLSADYFVPHLKARLRNVKFAGKTRVIRDYTLGNDGFEFFYVPYAGVTMKSRDAQNTSYYLKVNGKEKQFSWWIYGNKYEKAERRFATRYGITPDEASGAGYNVVAAGFRYRRQKKNSNSTYDCIGKLVFFIANKNGVFARTLTEKSNLDTILAYIRFNCKDTGIGYYVADDDDPFDGYFDTGAVKAIISADEDKDFGGRPVLHKDIMEDTITKEDVNMLLGRALHGKRGET